MNTNTYQKIARPVEFFNDTSLDKNTDFYFLNSELQGFYLKNFQKKIGQKNHSFKWSQNLAWNLHLLLTEILLTQDIEKRDRLLKDTKNWYIGQIKTYKAQTLYKKSPEIQEPTIITPEQIPRSRSLNRTNKLYIPKIRRITKEDIIQSTKKSYEKMQNQEKIWFGLNTSSFDTSLKEKSPINGRSNDNKPENKAVYSENCVYEKNDDFSEEKGLKLPQIYDFRSMSHKSKFLHQNHADSPIILRNPMRNAEIQEIGSIKGKLAVRNQTVCMKNLEDALMNAQSQALDTSLTPFPRGGEGLFKSKFFK